MDKTYPRIRVSHMTYGKLSPEQLSALPTNMVFTIILDPKSPLSEEDQITEQICEYVRILFGVGIEDFDYKILSPEELL